MPRRGYRAAMALAFSVVALTATALAEVPPQVGSPPTNAQRKALGHLFASGVAAAWNARAAMDLSQAPTVVIGDDWGNGKPPNLFSGKKYIDAQIVGGGIDPPGLSSSRHGYHTTGIVFGSFASDGSAKGVVTGAFPKRGKLVPIDGWNDASLWADETKFAPAIDAVPGHVVVNTSLSDGPVGPGPSGGGPAVDWIEQVRTLGLESRVFHATAAGNDGLAGGTAGGASSWSAAATRTDLEDNGTPVPPLTNTLSVENVEEASDASALACLNAQSNTGGSIAAPGTDVRSFDQNGNPLDLSGTSEASPVVAGVATYLWSIAPDLNPQQLKAAMLENARAPASCARTSAPLLDAYAAILSLDQTGTPAKAAWPVRFAILDKKADGKFDQKDLAAFAPKLKRSPTPPKRNWSRLDLNGDGFTGGPATAAFDLDRAGSARAGQTTLTSANATIEGNPVSYDENAVADADVLCFYAYSPLYTGSTSQRKQELKKLCKTPPVKIAFTSNRDGNFETYVMKTNGSAQTNLTNNAANELDPTWSPDRSEIAFATSRDGNTEIYVMNANGTAQTNLTNTAASNEKDPSWSPDGSEIAYNRGNGDIYVMNADGSAQTNLTNSGVQNFQPSWSPEGSEIAFTTMRDGDAEIYVVNTSGSPQTNLTDNPASDFQPSWSPDGSKIAFASTRDGNDEIYVMDANGTAPTRLTNNAASDTRPSWSPDGSKIAFTSTRDGNFEIYVMDATPGAAATRLTNNAAFDDDPDW